MLLELSEILACPTCGPPQVMVAVVHEGRGHLVERGFMACPGCDARFPIEAGVVHLAGRAEGESAEADAGAADAGAADSGAAHERAVIAAALLGLEGEGGLLLFGPGLDRVARAVAGLAERWSVVSLCRAAPGSGPSPSNLSHIVVPHAESLPVLSGRAAGVVLDGRDGERHVGEAGRALVPGGRLVVLAPEDDLSASLEGAGLAVKAADHRALLATRTLSVGS